MTCRLTSFAAPELKGALPGLVLSPYSIEVDQGVFGCCGATGFAASACGNFTLACELKSRLAGVRALARQYGATWKGERALTAELEGAHLDASLERLAALRQGTTRLGLATIRSPGAPTKTSVWAIAMAALWRFGFEVHVVVLGRTPLNELLPPRTFAPKRGLIIFVEGAARLWEPAPADDLEQLVSFAYGAMTPLWLDLVMPEPGAKDDGRQSARAQLTRRIGRIKADQAFSALRPDALSKLASLTEGLKAYLPKSRRPSSQRPSNTIKLPWDS